MKLGIASGLSPPKCIFLTENLLEREKSITQKIRGKALDMKEFPGAKTPMFKEDKGS